MKKRTLKTKFKKNWRFLFFPIVVVIAGIMATKLSGITAAIIGIGGGIILFLGEKAATEKDSIRHMFNKTFEYIAFGAIIISCTGTILGYYIPDISKDIEAMLSVEGIAKAMLILGGILLCALIYAYRKERAELLKTPFSKLTEKLKKLLPQEGFLLEKEVTSILYRRHLRENPENIIEVEEIMLMRRDIRKTYLKMFLDVPWNQFKDKIEKHIILLAISFDLENKKGKRLCIEILNSIINKRDVEICYKIYDFLDKNQKNPRKFIQEIVNTPFIMEDILGKTSMAMYNMRKEQEAQVEIVNIFLKEKSEEEPEAKFEESIEQKLNELKSSLLEIIKNEHNEENLKKTLSKNLEGIRKLYESLQEGPDTETIESIEYFVEDLCNEITGPKKIFVESCLEEKIPKVFEHKPKRVPKKIPKRELAYA